MPKQSTSTADKERPSGPNTSSSAIRLLVGFVAAALSHIIFQGAFGGLLYAVGLAPNLIWSLEPVGPLGVPHTINNIFWDGLWGMLYAFYEPRLTRHLGRSKGGLTFGLAPLLVFWLLVLPLKGKPIGDGFHPAEVVIDVSFDLVFGLGTAIFFWAGLLLVAFCTTRPGRREG